MNPRRRLWWKNKARAANAGIAAAGAPHSEEETLEDVVKEVKKTVAAKTPQAKTTVTTKKTKKTITASKKVKTQKTQ